MTTAELLKQFAAHAAAAGLTIDCPADGDVNARIAIIAEAPGPQETQMKLPLIGGSGKYLWDKLRQFNHTRRDCYITNVVKKQLVFKDKNDKVGVSKPELEHWRALLKWELSQLPNVQYLVVLGSVALEAIVGESKIDHWRGSLIENLPYGDKGRHYHVLCTHNPANIIRKPYLGPVFSLDLSKLDMHLRGAWKQHDVRAYYDPSPREAVQWCDKMIQEKLPVSVDIETTAGETACVGMTNDEHGGMCINYRDRNSNRWSVAEERLVWFAIQRVLRHRDVKLVAQNGPFDFAWLWYKDRIKAKSVWMDTLLAHHTLHPIWPHGLGFLVAQYTTHPYYKDELTAWKEGGDISTFWEYNVKDVCLTLACANKLLASLQRQKLDDFFFNTVMPRQPHLIASTVLGNKVDGAMKQQLTVAYRGQVDALRVEFCRLVQRVTGDPNYQINPNSNPQLRRLFFEVLKMVGKSASADKANRDYLISSPRTTDDQRAMLVALNEYAHEQKLFSVYVTAGIDPDGRMRSDYKQYGTTFVPGRLSSAGTLWDSGTNMQNIPEILRGMFVADTMEFME